MHGKRSAGILMHITSLQSPFGIGDLGPEAYAFADVLARCNQRHWQLLPLNPVTSAQSYSPYSSVSSYAGNTLLISPQVLAEEGLIPQKSLMSYRVPNKGKVSYRKVEAIKETMIDISFLEARKNHRSFETFCGREAYWLDDFAMFMTLKKKFRSEPWYRWPVEFRLRKEKTLTEFTRKHAEALQKVRWAQFLFHRQWAALKKYCRKSKIRLLGDLPFYVSHDSVDVWSRPEIFRLKKDGSMAGVAGVPPDYFNAKGQLWGMPVFEWPVLKGNRYDWWVWRIRKNLELFDDLRLDHFRAFSDYWEVPATQKTAVRGKWKEGPGPDLFSVLQQDFPDLPFIAEDLGDISPSVHELRDQFQLPGMKVLQFAFGDNLPASEHAPHNIDPNFVAYTGTHDNNTTRGWFMNEASNEVRRQVASYVGHPVSNDNIHVTLGRMAYASRADTVIIPIQDLLGLDHRARMNTPASSQGNWLWRMETRVPAKIEERLKSWTHLYRRN